MIDSALRCAVLPEADRLVRERLTRNLSDALAKDPQIAAIDAKVSYEPVEEIEPGAKGGAVDLTQLLVTTLGAGALPLVIRQVVAAIQTWCNKDSRRRVKVTHGKVSFEIVGKPTKGQLKIVEDALSRITATAKDDEQP